MSDRAPYSRVYWSVMDDEKFDGIRENVRHMGSWCLLLIVADMAHPAPAFPPATVPRASLKALAEAGLVDVLSGGRFRIHGLEAERGRRSEAGRNAADVRWQSERSPSAMRTHSERDANPMLDETSIDKTRARRDEHNGARDGLPNLDRAAFDALEKRTGHVASQAGERQLSEYDRLVGDHGLTATLAAFDAVSGGQRMTARQLVWGAVKVLEPFVDPKVLGELEREAEAERARVNRRAPKPMEPWQEEFRATLEAHEKKLAGETA